MVAFPVYRRWPNLTRLILVAVEDPEAHKEKVEVEALLDSGDLSIEHVMPQSIGNDKAGRWWQAELGDDWSDIHSEWLHSVGNLTLTGYNTKLSNRDFVWKKGEFAKSNLNLNRWFGSVDHWTGAEIRARGEAITSNITKIWPEAVAFEPKAAGVKLDPGEVPARPSSSMAPLRRELWEWLAPACAAAGVPMSLTPSADSWLGMRLGLSKGAQYLVARTTKGMLAIQYLSNWYETESMFNWLRSHQDEIRASLDETPTWVNSPGSYQQYFEVIRFADLADKESWPDHREWVVKRLVALQRTLAPLVGRYPQREITPEPSLEAFLADLQEANPSVAPTARRLVDWASREMDEFYLSVNRGRLSWIPQVKTGGKWHHLVRLMSDGTMEFRLGQALKKQPFSDTGVGNALLQRVNTIPLVNIPAEALGGTVSLPLAMFGDNEAVEALLGCLNWFVDKAHGDGTGAPLVLGLERGEAT